MEASWKVVSGEERSGDDRSGCEKEREAEIREVVVRGSEKEREAEVRGYMDTRMNKRGKNSNQSCIILHLLCTRHISLYADLEIYSTRVTMRRHQILSWEKIAS